MDASTSAATTKTIIIDHATAKAKYPVRKGLKTAGGSPVRDNGDEVAVRLRGSGPPDWEALAKANGFGDDYARLQEAGKNPGQLRMFVGSKLRTIQRRHDANPKNPQVDFCDLDGQEEVQSNQQELLEA